MQAQSNTHSREPHVTRAILVLSPFRVRYSEIDGQGVVFNAHYLTYFDTTITEYFRALGYDQYADAKKTGEDFHVVKSVIEYKARSGSTRNWTSARAWRGSAIQASPSNSPSSSRAALRRS